MGKNQRNKQKQKLKQPQENQEQPQEKPKETQKQHQKPHEKQKQPLGNEKENQKQPQEKKKLPNKAGTLIYQQNLANLKELMVNKKQELKSLSTAVEKLEMTLAVLALIQDNNAVNEISNKVLFVFMESLLKKIEEMEKQNRLLKNKETESEIRDSELIERDLDIDRKWEGFDLKLNRLMDEIPEINNIQKWLQIKLDDNGN